MGRKPLKVAHRGFHQTHIENSMEAFRAAYAAGCDMVEFDVQVSRDGVPFIFHDDDCHRLIGIDEVACMLTWKELQSLSMLPKDKTTRPLMTYRIPSLKEFLEEFGQRAFYLELKVPESKKRDAAYLDALGRESSRMVHAAGPHPDTFLGSFHTELLCSLAKAKAYPQLAGIFEDYSRFHEVYFGTDRDTAASIKYYSVSAEIFQKYVRNASSGIRDLGLQKFLIWNIQGEKQFRQARELGVMGLVTDDIETLLNLY